MKSGGLLSRVNPEHSVADSKDDNNLYGVSDEGYLDLSKNETAYFYLSSVLDSIKQKNDIDDPGLGLKPYNPDDEGLLWYDVNTGQYYLVYATESRDSVVVDPHTLWDQHAPYNLRYPIHEPSGCHYIAGCVPVAVGQICAYHRKATLPITLNWDAMLESPIGIECSYEGVRDISEFFFYLKDYCKVSMTAYPKEDGTWGFATGATLGNALSAFHKLGYTDSNITNEISKVYNSIRNHGPVFIAGNDLYSGGGHAWVITGYSVFTTHYKYHLKDDPTYWGQTDVEKRYMKMNWGWAGNGNGYYLVGANYNVGAYSFRNFEYIVNIK